MRLQAIALAISGFVLASCASAEVMGCKGGSTDLAPTRIGDRDVVKDVEWLTERMRARPEVIGNLGPARVSNAEGDAWVYGTRREGRDCNRDGSYSSTYFVRYAIVSINFDAASCNVTEIAYITPNAAPDPFGKEISISKETVTCKGFIMRNKPQ